MCTQARGLEGACSEGAYAGGNAVKSSHAWVIHIAEGVEAGTLHSTSK